MRQALAPHTLAPSRHHGLPLCCTEGDKVVAARTGEKPGLNRRRNMTTNSYVEGEPSFHFQLAGQHTSKAG